MPKKTTTTTVKQKRKRRDRQQKKAISPGGAQTNMVLQRSDVRIATSAEMTLSLTNQLKTITINKIINENSLFWFCGGFLSRALERGYLASSSDNFNAYYCAQFMENLLLNYILSQQVPSTQLPYWLLCICHAISPKSAPFEAGKVNYQFTWGGSQPVVPTVNTVIGFSPYGYFYSLGVPTGATVNGFPVLTTSGAAYTDAKGSTAFQEVCKFMEVSVQSEKKKPVSRIIPSSSSTPFQNDVSAFGLFQLAEGTGASGQGGGIYGQIQLEVPILHPLLVLAGCGEDSFTITNPFRNFNWSTPVSGDPMTLSAMASVSSSTRHLSMKRNIRIKPIDFFEFGDVLARWVVKIIQSYYNDVSEQLTLTEAQKAVCPITLQEMLLILRSVIMGAFKESQSAVQGIYPFLPASSTDNQFVPFVCGTNCCPLLTTDMSLPSLMVENIRALTQRIVRYGGTPQNIRYYLPCLGQYALDLLTSADYQVTYKDSTGTETTFSAFTAGILWEKEVRTKEGKMEKQNLVEAQISMVDGSSGSNLVFINDSAQLKNLSAMWNTWVSNSGVGSYTMKLCTYGTESGINALASIAMTRIWQNVAPGTGPKKNSCELKGHPHPVAESKITDLRLKGRFKELVSGPYAGRTAIVDTSQGEFIASAYEQLLQYWILATDFDETVLGENSTVVQRWQFLFGESYSVPRVAANLGTTLAALHDVYASKMTKAKLAEKTDTENLLDQTAAQGRGGILSGVVASLVEAAVPSLGGTAKAVASMLPI